MNKSWISEKNRFSKTYIEGVDSFLSFAKQNVDRTDNLILCPCCSCLNTRFKTVAEVKRDLHINGFSSNYTQWVHHGDKIVLNDSENGVDDGMTDDDTSELNANIYDMLFEMAEKEPECFKKIFETARIKLYEGCKESLLSVVVKLMHIKVKNKWSNKSFDMLLEFLKTILPEGDTLPSSFYGAKKVLDEIGLGYEEIDVCKNDCALFYKEYAKEDKCPICKESRWKFISGKVRKTPHKILRYFPLKPRLQRLFMFSKTSLDMRWHKDKRVEEDGVMRHPADSKAWKHFDEKYRDFAQDPRNIRLGIATDGFTPWSNLGNSYSMWPVIIVVYNLPAFKFMKEEHLIMSLLIPGPRSPGKELDVFIRPVVDDLKDLWVGIQTYDYCTKEVFKMRAMALYTISDFLGYNLLSGWVTAGRMACPHCLDETRSERLRSKTRFVGHRCFLPKNHAWRKNKAAFNGKVEYRSKPKDLSGIDVLVWLESLVDLFGKPGKHPALTRKRKRNSDPNNQANWVKKSIFFELPYWCHLLIRHILDVMHIEKNICDNIIATLLDIKGKTKDNEKAREDLRDWGIRKELHMKVRGTDNKPVKPVACYTLPATEKEQFLEFLKSVKLPDSCGSNISRCVKDKKLTGLKSHDCHILLQRLIPAGTRGLLTKEVNEALCELGDFFAELCSKTLRVENIEKLEKNIPMILCKLEKIFPPAFFTVMVHLAVHLPREALIAGPVHPRWMYPIERNLGTLKTSVRNRSRPEGSIAQAYVVKESIQFMSMYLKGIETKFNQRTRNFDGFEGDEVEDISIFTIKARPFGYDRSKFVRSGPSISDEELEKAHQFILRNCTEVDMYFKIFKAEINGIALEEVVNLELSSSEMKRFPRWLKGHINDLVGLWALANGPFRLDTKCFKGCMVNEVRFHTRDRDIQRTTQNSGLVAEGYYQNEVVEFFGFLSRVVELVYAGNRKVVLFQCEWFDTRTKRNKRVDKHFISINVGSRWYKEDPYVLPINVKQVFYVSDTKLGKDWQLVQRVQHRHLWDLPQLEPKDTVNPSFQEPLQQFESNGVCDVIEDEDLSGKLARHDIEAVEVDDLIFHKIRNDNVNENQEEDDDEIEFENLEKAVGDYDCLSTDEDEEFEYLADLIISDDDDFVA